MKKILIVLVGAVTIGMVSCKKESEVKPSPVKAPQTVATKDDMGGWD